jgi:hypothetical protein
VAGELSSISLVAYPMAFALPLTRFGGFVWLIAAGALMPKTAEKRNTETNSKE